VDSKHSGFYGVSVAYDTVEGNSSCFNTLWPLIDVLQTKLQLPEDATLDDQTARAQLRLGLFSYPVLQAADILIHR
jgi:tryptophanyl-tRNA synthetase